MLSLPKKSDGDKGHSASAIPWRPDFRDVGALPDTKTVRTSFFINLVAITLTGSLALLLVQNELHIASLRGALQDVEGRIVSATPGSDKAVETFKRFQAEEAKFNEAASFLKDSFRVTNFLIHLGEILPPGVVVRRVDYRGAQGITVTGAVKGLDASASDVASGVVRQLQGDAVLAERFSSVKLVNLGRNTVESSLNLELLFTFKTGAKGGGK